jgi:ankyrin repeat protein
MIKIKSFLVLIILNSMLACSQGGFGPGYRFDLFENTPNWVLAKAVETENEAEINKLIKSGKYDINLRESKYGRTLLSLAVGNDKYYSTKVLLENNANVNIRDLRNTSPIEEATKYISFKKNTLEILKLLVKHGANVNDADITKRNEDTVQYIVPLVNATSNFNCTKFLLDKGANLYVKYDGVFPVWHQMLIIDFDEYIFVAKYLIVEKKMPIPNPISFSVPEKKPQDIFYFLNLANFRNDSAKTKVRQDILDYLHKIDFPKSQVYIK